MNVLLEILVYGAVQSAVYAMLALGFCLIFGVAGVVNLAHTTFFMIGAYLIYTLTSLANIPLPLGLVCAIFGTGLLGIAVQHFAIKPLIKSEYSVMMITIALAFFCQELVLSVFGPVDRNVKGFIDEKLTVFGLVDIDAQRILTLVVAVLLIVLLWWFINRTKMGNAIMAVAQNREGATFVGINATRIFLVVMFISACLAAVAGAFIAPTVGARPHMWENPLVRCFAVVVLGGLGSLEGTILAALIIGYTEVIVSFTLSSYLSELVILGIFMTVLIVRPSGLLGRRQEA
ncbi:MAG: branched-chain amino acid ABC transporter permease [Thermodesulfobacteriota bacterium]